MTLRWRLLALFLGDSVVLFVSLSAALLVRQGGLVELDFLLSHLGAFAGVFSAWLGVFYAVGLYDFHRIRDLVTAIRDTLIALILNTLLSTALFYLFSPYMGMTPKTHLLLTGLFGHAAILGWRHLWVRVLSRGVLAQRVAFWGESPLIRAMIQDLKARPYLGFKVAATNMPGGLSVGRSRSVYWLPEGGEISRRGLPMDLVIIDADLVETNASLGQDIFSLALKGDIPITTHLDFYEKVYRKVPPHQAGKPAWLLSHVLPRNKQLYLWSKRAIDVTGSALGLVLIGPLLVLITVLSRVLNGGGSPFYAQKRVGYLGKEFQIWKFRTMVEGADKRGPLWDLVRPSEQVTRFGEFLRRLRLDELPQLWNVLRGEMSLTGPRPEWIEEVRVLEKTVPYYHLRHLVKPGITGWAQINFKATNSREDSIEKLHYDLYYVKNISLALDLGILLKTVKRVFLQEDSFFTGISELPEPSKPVPLPATVSG